MSGRSVLLWVVLPFLLLCALALWLTRPAPAPPPPPYVVSPPIPGTPPSAAPTPGAPPPPRQVNLPRVPPPPLPPNAPPALARAAEEDALLASLTPDPVAREDVRMALRAVRPLLDRCFEDVAERNPGEQTVTLRFTVEEAGGEGLLAKSEVADTRLQDPMLRACLEDAMQDARFAAPRGGERLTVSYPHTYRPSARPGRPGSPPARGVPDPGEEAPPEPLPPGR